MGYSKELFLDQSKIPQKYVCMICKNVLKKPVKVAVDYFCYQCVQNTIQHFKRLGESVSYNFSYPTDEELEELNQLKLRCELHGNGCKDILTIGSYDIHESCCKYRAGNNYHDKTANEESNNKNKSLDKAPEPQFQIDKKKAPKSIEKAAVSREEIDKKKVPKSIDKVAVSREEIDKNKVTKSIDKVAVSREEIDKNKHTKLMDKAAVSREEIDKMKVTKSMDKVAVWQKEIDKMKVTNSMDKVAVWQEEIDKKKVTKSMDKASQPREETDKNKPNQSIDKAAMSREEIDKNKPSQSIDKAAVSRKEVDKKKHIKSMDRVAVFQEEIDKMKPNKSIDKAAVSREETDKKKVTKSMDKFAVWQEKIDKKKVTKSIDKIAEPREEPDIKKTYKSMSKASEAQEEIDKKKVTKSIDKTTELTNTSKSNQIPCEQSKTGKTRVQDEDLEVAKITAVVAGTTKGGRSRKTPSPRFRYGPDNKILAVYPSSSEDDDDSFLEIENKELKCPKDCGFVFTRSNYEQGHDCNKYLQTFKDFAVEKLKNSNNRNNGDLTQEEQRQLIEDAVIYIQNGNDPKILKNYFRNGERNPIMEIIVNAMKKEKVWTNLATEIQKQLDAYYSPLFVVWITSTYKTDFAASLPSKDLLSVTIDKVCFMIWKIDILNQLQRIFQKGEDDN